MYYETVHDQPAFNPFLPTYKVSDFDRWQFLGIYDHHMLTGEVCAICLCEFNDPDDDYYESPAIRLVKCKHTFHEACLQPRYNYNSFVWLK